MTRTTILAAAFAALAAAPGLAQTAEPLLPAVAEAQILMPDADFSMLTEDQIESLRLIVFSEDEPAEKVAQIESLLAE